MVKEYKVGPYKYYMEENPKPFDRSKLLSPEKRKKALKEAIEIIEAYAKLEEEEHKRTD